MSGIPGRAPGVADVVAQQKGSEALLGAGDVAPALLPGPHDVAERLLIGGRHVDSAERAGAQRQGEVTCIATIGLDALAGAPRNQRWRGDEAALALGSQIALGPEAARASLVDELLTSA